MSNVIVDKNKLDLLANAISAKSGEELTLTLDEMVEAVDGIEQGIVPTGNINITQSGTTDVTNYATATVPEGQIACYTDNVGFYTSDGERWWHVRPVAAIDINDDSGVPGYINDGTYQYGNYYYAHAVPSGTTVTPSTSSQTIGGSNYMMEGAVTVNAIPSDYVGSGIDRRDDTDLTTNGATVYVPSGYYDASASKNVANGDIGNPTVSYSKTSTQHKSTTTYTGMTAGYISSIPNLTTTLTLESKTATPSTSQQTITPTGDNYYLNSVTVDAMPSGTAGTPTATKGTVSNHSVSVTPSVTNSAGYISGGTKTGTAVTVSASELVSGTYTASASGTADITNYATLSVPSGTAGTPTATKSAVSNHAVTVTPSVTNSTGWITGSTKTGTAVTVSASELVSGSETKTANGTYDVTNLAELVVNVSGGGGNPLRIGDAQATLSSAGSSISFTNLSGNPTSFVVMASGDLATGASPYKVATVVFDGSDLHVQTITNTSNAQVTYDGSSFSKSYSNGTLTISSTGAYFQATTYYLTYSYDGGTIDTQDVQVGSGATSITFTDLEDEPTYWSLIFKSNFGTSSGY